MGAETSPQGLDTRIELTVEKVEDIGGRPFRIRRSFVDDLAKHDQGQRIAALKRSLLVLHSPVDTVVSIENASTILLAAKHPKSFG